MPALREIIRLSGVLHPAGPASGQPLSFADRRIHLSLLDDSYTLALRSCLQEGMHEVADTLRKFKDLAFELTEPEAWQEMLEHLTSYLLQILEVTGRERGRADPSPD